MSRNTRKEWTKVLSQAQYSIWRSTASPHLWQVRLSASGGRLRRQFHAPDLASARDEAPRAAGLVPANDIQMVPLADAFEAALKETHRGERSRQDWNRTTERFLVWLQKHHPLCTHWGAMTRAIVREYLAVYHGKSANYRRLLLQPVLQTAGYMHREHGFPNIGERLGIGSKLKKTPPAVYLEDVLSFCDWARDNRPHLEVGACLQGLAGLQMLEALRLTWDKVDLERGLVEISGEVKNEYRNRVIPVAKRVVEALRRARARQAERKIQSVREFVVTGERGSPYEDFASYSRQMGTAIRKWNPGCGWAPKDLRNCLPTFATMEGIHGTVWEQYIGHAPKTVTERHYVPRLASRTGGERAALQRQAALFMRLVVEPVEEFASSPDCRILQPGVLDPERVVAQLQ